ncbi:hypothetical protein F2Q70_00008840 [Brassica cretica]|uniref:Uncharacterized protein n=1 Tax=Brassica cretica TaxID=69181 RepID=A0A8S9LY44_BRACR|nr:hypothetical protein F2Q70_00008840 [Brassica cretica]
MRRNLSPTVKKTRSRGGPWREKIGLHVQVVIPGNGGYHRSGDAGFSPGGGGFLSFAAAGSSSREEEVFSAPSSPVLAPEGRGSHSSTMSVLIPEGWLFGSEWMRSRYKVKLSIIGDDDKRKKAESDDALRDKFDGVEPFGRTAGMRQEEDKPTRAARSGQRR